MRVPLLLAYIALSSVVFAIPPPKVTLLELAKKEFATRKLTEAEQKLFASAQEGKAVNELRENDKENDPATAANWPDQRVIHAKCLEWLCTNREASAIVTSRGIQIFGVRIEGDLNLSDTEIDFPLFAGMCAFHGNVLLKRTHIKGLYLVGCSVITLNANEANINAAVLLRDGFKAKGEIVLLGATIGGTLDCRGAQLTNSDGDALNANRAKIGGHVFLRDGFKSNGNVDFIGAAIGADLDCSGAEFENPERDVLSADGKEKTKLGGMALDASAAKINGSVFLRRGFRSRGEVNLTGATIGGTLICDGAQLTNPIGYALQADSIKVAGSVLLRNDFKADGGVGFANSEVKGYFDWYKILPAKNTWLDLRSTKVATLLDDESGWPVEGNLFLDGFTYDRIDENSPTVAKTRIRWLHRQPRDKFLPQPYEHLASVLKNMGHERELRKVMIEKNLDHANFTKPLSQEWWWYNVFGWLIGYGYAPSRAFFISVGVILFGWWRFHRGFTRKLILPSNENGYEKDSAGNFVLKNGEREISDDYPKFNAFVYSLESFVPLLKLDQTSNWTPSANRGNSHRLWRLHYKSGGVLRMYLWCQIIVGWVLTSLWVGALTGLVKS